MSRRPVKRRRANDKKLKIILIAAAAVLLVAVVALVLVLTGGGSSDAEDAAILESGTYFEGVSIAGVDVSGMTMAEAEPLIKQKATETLEALSVTYQVDGVPYPLGALQLGASIDHAQTLKEALFYGRTGTAAERRQQIAEAEENGVNFELKIAADRDAILASLAANSPNYDIEPVDAQVTVEEHEQEDYDDGYAALKCSGKVVYTDEIIGSKVDAEWLADEILAALESGSYAAPIVAEKQETLPEITREQIEGSMQLMASYSTKFKDSAYGRRYNIWKMSTVVNGVVLQPGEVWSINDAAGPRTTETGWKDAAGIVSGAYVDEPGGGICQVSSTLYNACLRAEIKIETRKHHSWPLAYVPEGLDATISTGGPDFVISNPYDVPVVLIVNCDGMDSRTVEVEIYGPEMDYKLNFTSEIVKEVDPGTPEVVENPSLSPGKSVEVKPTHKGLSVEVYKHYIDKETGEEYDKELYYTDYYAPFAGKIEVGPSASPTESPTESPTHTPSLPPTQQVTPTPPAESSELPTESEGSGEEPEL